MAARWLGRVRPHRKNANFKLPARGGVALTVKRHLHALGAGGVLVMAAAMNFALYPDALAEVVTGERQIVGFVPEEPAAGAVPTMLPAVAVDEAEVRLLAATTWAEARSEGEDGMRAVAHVMVNRVGDRFGDSLESVIMAPAQFSAWNRGDPNRPLAQNPERYATGGIALETWEAAQKIAREVLSGQSVDPTGGSLFYHTRAVRPRWSRYGEGRRVIGEHIFYRDVPDSPNSRRARRNSPRVTQVADNRVRGVLPAPSTTIDPAS